MLRDWLLFIHLNLHRDLPQEISFTLVSKNEEGGKKTGLLSKQPTSGPSVKPSTHVRGKASLPSRYYIFHSDVAETKRPTT